MWVEKATEEGVQLAEPQPLCPVTPGWLCDKAGDLTAPGQRHIFNQGSQHRQQVWCQRVTRFVFFRFDFVQIYILVERTKAVLQFVCEDFTAACASPYLLGTLEPGTRLSREFTMSESSLL